MAETVADSCARAILDRAGPGRLKRLIQGRTWILAIVHGPRDRRVAGMAGLPHNMLGRCCIPSRSGGEEGDGVLARDTVPGDVASIDIALDPRGEDASAWSRLLLSPDPGEAAAGLAVTNALLALEPEPAADMDGVAWLLEKARGRDVAVVGHFPFVDRRLRPIARRVWVFEREPVEGEFGEDDTVSILPKAEIVVLTGGTLANHTLDSLVRLVDPATPLLLLGPSTPVTSALFRFGFDALSGVRVVDVDAAATSVEGGESFRNMTGLKRVTLLR